MNLVALAPEHLSQVDVPADLIGKAEAFVEGDEVLAVVGFIDAGRYAEVGLILTERARRDPVTVVRLAKRYLAGIKDAARLPGFESLRYLTAIIDPHDRRAIRWIEYLGFKFEGRQVDGMLRYVRA